MAKDSTRPIRGRAVLLGLALVPLHVWWTLVMEEVYFSGWPTSVSIFYHCLVTLAALLLLNGALRRLRPAAALTPAELLLTYAMISVAVGIAGHDQQMNYLRGWVWPVYQWMFDPNYAPFQKLPWPARIFPGDEAAAKAIFEGYSTLYQPEHLRVWLLPLLFLISFLALLQLVGLAINLVFLRQWADHERLTFPLAQLPVEMATAGRRFWQRPALWIGFGLVFGVDLLNGLSQLYPVVPSVPWKHLPSPWTAIALPPWSGLRYMRAYLFPYLLGLSFLLPTDLSLSCLVFYAFVQAQFVGAVSLGYPLPFPYQTGAVAPHVVDQGVGVYLTLFGLLLYSARGHLRRVREVVVGRADAAPDERRAYRAALAVGVPGLLALAWLVHRTGLNGWLALAAMGAYFVMVTVVCKVRAELGPPMYDLHFAGPDRWLALYLGPANLTRADWIGVGFLFNFNRGMRNLSLPHLVEGLWAVRRGGGRPYGAALGLALAGVLGAAVTCWGMAHLGFEVGFNQQAQARLTGQGWERIRPWFDELEGPHAGALGGVAVGVGLTLTVMWLRQRFIGFPLHAAGYALATNWAMSLMWLPMLIAYLVKTSILRYSGGRGYRAALPFFLGVALGDFLAGSLWSLYGLWREIPTYSVTW